MTEQSDSELTMTETSGSRWSAAELADLSDAPTEAALLQRNSPAALNAPEPNPHFTFPSLPPAPSTSSNLSRRSRPPNLPIMDAPFMFPPPSSSSSTASTATSQPSPTRSMAMAMRGLGHRRSDSEFIGGDGSRVGPGLMSSSPTRGEGALPLPPPPPAGRGPPGGRRGHAHRRSGALSQHDLSAITAPRVGQRPGSGPSTPNDATEQNVFTFGTSATDSTTGDGTPASADFVPASESVHTSPGKSRPKVGFSEKVEYISGRPLSQISLDTQSSVSTIRPGHSVTNSISSVFTGSPESSKRSRPSLERSSESEGTPDRPKSASALEEGSPRFAKMLEKGTFIRPAVGTGSPRPLRNRRTMSESVLRSNLSRNPRFTGPVAPLTVEELGSGNYGRPPEPIDENTELDRDALRVPASAAPSGKEGHPSPLQRRPPTPTSTHGFLPGGVSDFDSVEFADFDVNDLNVVNFDEDTDCVIRDANYTAPMPTFERSSRRRKNEGSNHSLGALDLDALYQSTDPPTTATSNNSKQRMCSSGEGVTSRTDDMQNHRRTESAPAMQGFDRASLMSTRAHNSSQMENVFEEDESEGKQQVAPHVLPFPVAHPAPDVLKLETGAPSKNQENTRPGTQCHGTQDPTSTEKDTANLAPYSTLDDAVSEEQPRISVMTKSSDESTITPTIAEKPSTEYFPPHINTAREFPYGTERSGYNSSAYSSPSLGDFSFDPPRLDTANSSITDRTNWSSYRPTGPGNSAYSMEDVPSLTSSAESATSGYPQRTSGGASRPSNERASSTPVVRPRIPRPATPNKRSSLASLSRLMSGSFGEKSKLSIASNAESEDTPEAVAKKKRGRRISRMLSFWKRKEEIKGATVS